MNKWYIEKGDQGDIVLSTRIRFARNLDAYAFPSKLDLAGKKAVNETVRDAVTRDNSGTFGYIEMNSLTRSQAVSLAERHLISPEFTTNRDGRALLLTQDESVSIMLCEEDHIRLQVMKSGLALNEAYDIANSIDNMIDAKLHYAFDERMGYLTQCPTNLGTAMRASVMLHLPALTALGRIPGISATVSKLGLVIRGAYGEGSSSKGNIYQLSNQITLGITEQAAIANLNAITMQIITQERAAQESLLKNPVQIDKIWRAMGILKSARLLSCDEFMELISLVRVGVAQNIFETQMEKVNELIVMMQPATVNASEGRELDPSERDSIRAAKVRETLLREKEDDEL